MQEQNPKLKAAIRILSNELKDPGYRQAWVANIAMAFQDECSRQKSRDSRRVRHQISNAAAENFIKLLEKE